MSEYDITNPQIREYAETVMPPRGEALEALHQAATTKQIPIIKHEMEAYLNFMVSVHKPKAILEIGTAVGYSGSIMLEASLEANLTTLELSDEMIKWAETTFLNFGFDQRVKIIKGDAADSLDDLNGSYDFVFIDAAKGQYKIYFDKCLPLLKEGAILIIDNVLQDGLVAKSRYAIPRRQRTIHSRMRSFIESFLEDPRFYTTLLPMADGALVAYYKGGK